MMLGYDFMVVSIEFLMNWTCTVRESKKSEVFNEIDSWTNYSDGQGQRGVSIISQSKSYGNCQLKNQFTLSFKEGVYIKTY